MNKIYEIEVTTNSGKKTTLEQYKGKALLIVNTASECGFTPQYEGLEKLQESYGDKLVVLGFPCNQFGGQEPGTDSEIKSFCEMRFHTTFPLFSKVEVNGSHAHPLFEYLKEELPGIAGTKAIKWNFTKFLVSAEGEPLKRYAPNEEPSEIEKDLKQRGVL